MLKYSFPIDLGGGADVSAASAADYYCHVEQEFGGGYFPIGTNTVWHGGVHVHTKVGTPVLACFDGTIVAARLGSDPGHYGSRDFILIEHQFIHDTPEHKHTLLEAHRIEDVLERNHPGYRRSYNGYGTSGGRWVCSTFSSHVLDRCGYSGFGPGDDNYRLLNVYNLPEGQLIAAINNTSHANHWRLAGAERALTQSGQGESMTFDELQPGDFVQYWGTTSAPPYRFGHAVIVEENVVNGRIMMHSSHSGTWGVCVYPTLLNLRTKLLAYGARPNGNKKRFYSLYMHLNTEALDVDNPNLQNLKWLAPTGNTQVLSESLTVYIPKQVDGKWTEVAIGNMQAGQTLTTSTETAVAYGFKYDHSDGSNNTVIWTNPPSATDLAVTNGIIVVRKSEVKTARLDLKLFEYLKNNKNKVVQLKRRVKAGEPIWTSGTYGSPDCRAGLIHWEIFSDENLLAEYSISTEATPPLKSSTLASDVLVFQPKKVGGSWTVVEIGKIRAGQKLGLSTETDQYCGFRYDGSDGTNNTIGLNDPTNPPSGITTLVVKKSDIFPAPTPVVNETKFNEDWRVAEDPDKDYNMDCKAILNMVEQDLVGWNDKLTFSEIKRFYNSTDESSPLRQYACKFVSEWGVDLGKAIPELKGHWYTGHLEERIKPYLWWQEAAALKVVWDKPVAWHYNPIKFLETLAADPLNGSVGRIHKKNGPCWCGITH